MVKLIAVRVSGDPTMPAAGRTWPAKLWLCACALGILAAFVFLAFPEIDLSISRAFHVRSGTFFRPAARLGDGASQVILGYVLPLDCGFACWAGDHKR